MIEEAGGTAHKANNYADGELAMRKMDVAKQGQHTTQQASSSTKVRKNKGGKGSKKQQQQMQ